MKRNRLVSVVFYVVFFLLPAPDSSMAKVYIDIYAPFATRFPIVIPNFKNTGPLPDKNNLSVQIPKVIAQDLEFSGFFRIIDPVMLSVNTMPQGLTADTISWENWSIIGAEALITGGFSIKGENLITELRLFDVVQRKFITGKKYFGKFRDYRYIAHKFSNEAFKKLTGERGIFETKIVFVKSLKGAKEIYSMDYDGGNLKKITAYNSLSLFPEWSPDGKKIAFTSYKDGNPNLYIKELANGKVKKISSKKGINIAPSWSPDGKKIALTLSLDNGNSEIYLMYLNNKRLKRLTYDWATDVSPAWSPDSKKLAFVSNRAGSPHIFCLDLKSGKIRRLTFEGSYNTSPDWSPRGDIIAYTGRYKGTFNIYTIRSNGAENHQLTYNQGDNEDPSWSPDGRFLAFSSNRSGKREIYIMRSDGTGQKRITSDNGENGSPDWSPFFH